MLYASSQKPLTFVRLNGAAFRSVFDDLAALRIRVFRDFPYLYEGSVAYEKDYLETYARSEKSFLLAAYDGDRMVGATTALPLIDETAEVQQPFMEAGYNLNQVFYFGESILLPDYRGQRIGHRFFDEREAWALRFNQYTITCFCAVQRPDNHPLRPVDYQPLDLFWYKRGYSPVPGLQSNFTWADLNETAPSAKPMQYWLRQWD